MDPMEPYQGGAQFRSVLGATHLTEGFPESVTPQFDRTQLGNSSQGKQESHSVLEYFDNPNGSFIHTIDRSISNNRGINIWVSS